MIYFIFVFCQYVSCRCMCIRGQRSNLSRPFLTDSSWFIPGAAQMHLADPRKEVCVGASDDKKHMTVFGFDDLLQMLLFCKVIKQKMSALEEICRKTLNGISLQIVYLAYFLSLGADERVSSYNSMLYSQGSVTVFLLNGTFGDDWEEEVRFKTSVDFKSDTSIGFSQYKILYNFTFTVLFRISVQ